MSEISRSFYSKFTSTCAYQGCPKAHVISKGDLIRIEGERRPRNENTKRLVYHHACWDLKQGVKVEPDISEESKDFVRQGKDIDAIRVIREVKQIGLKDSKDLVDSWRAWNLQNDVHETENVLPPKQYGHYVTDVVTKTIRKPIIRRTDVEFKCKTPNCKNVPTHEYHGSSVKDWEFFKRTISPYYCVLCLEHFTNIRSTFHEIEYEDTEITPQQKVTEETMPENDLARMIALAVQPLLKANEPTLVHIQTEDDGEIKDMGMQHHSFPTLLSIMSARQASGFRLNIWLTGPAGSGKTTAASKCAEALDLKFYFTGALDNPYGLLGFVDANGKVVRTQFREAYEYGGVFLFDEIDGSTPSAVLPFNAALANGHCAFPDGVIERHKDFVCIAAANTWGLGASNDYVGRLKLDAASLDRFVQLAWDVDETLETATCGNETWAARVQVVRACVRDKGIKVVISPRASYYGAALLASGMKQVDVERITLRKAMTDDQWQSVNGK